MAKEHSAEGSHGCKQEKHIQAEMVLRLGRGLEGFLLVVFSSMDRKGPHQALSKSK